MFKAQERRRSGKNQTPYTSSMHQCWSKLDRRST